MALRCLIVDDSREFLASSSRLLESQGLDIVGCASSSAEAEHLAESLRPDVVLVDVQLGAENGFDVARRLATLPSAACVVMISSHAEEDLLELLAESPAAGFLSKRAVNAEAIAALVD